MALKAVQITVPTATATNLLTSPPFSMQSIVGTVSDPVSLIVKNEDGSLMVWIGGPDVDQTHGQSLPPGGAIPMALLSGDAPWAYAPSGTPIVSVLIGQQ